MHGHEHQIHGWKWLWPAHEDGEPDFDLHDDGIELLFVGLIYGIDRRV